MENMSPPPPGEMRGARMAGKTSNFHLQCKLNLPGVASAAALLDNIGAVGQTGFGAFFRLSAWRRPLDRNGPSKFLGPPAG